MRDFFKGSRQIRRFHGSPHRRIVPGILILVITGFVATSPDWRHPDVIVTAQTRLAAGQYRSEAKGLDSCNAPSHSQMAAFWGNSDWWWWAIYVGGSAMSCANTNVTAAWIDQEVDRGWRLLPTWVGPQAPCSSYAKRMPSNTSDAYDKGVEVAGNAYAHVANDLDMYVYDLPIAYDLEGGWDTTNTACLNAVKAFMRGWTHYLHQGTATQKSGLYGSAGGSALDEFWSISPNPDFIWAARYDGNPDTGALTPYVPSNHWGSARHKQYAQNASVTHGGVTLLVDRDCSAGPIYGVADTTSDPACS